MVKKLIMMVGCVWFAGVVGMQEVYNFAPVHEDPKEKETKELFLEYWKIYLKNYIQDNDITLNGSSNKNSLE